MILYASNQEIAKGKSEKSQKTFEKKVKKVIKIS